MQPEIDQIVKMAKKSRTSSVKVEHSEVLQRLEEKKEKLVQYFKKKEIIKKPVCKPAASNQCVAHPPVLQAYKPTIQTIVGETVVARAQSNVQNWCSRQKIDLYAVQNIAELMKNKKNKWGKW